MAEETIHKLNFIEEMVKEDIQKGKHNGRVQTRFPPEPNGYLHIGHSKAIYTNFEIAKKYGGKTNLRFDDTNPTNEDVEYVEAIKKDIQWLGYQWDGEPKYTSDYFDTLYEYAVKLIKKGKAYVDHSSYEEINEMKGNTNTAGTDSPFRNRSIEENVEWFEKMKNGDLEEGTCVLRAKIDMSSPNMHMRDPIIYRIKKESHHRTADKWKIYPMYDFAHGQSDSIEKVTHSLCSIEFENHRPLYNWFIEQLDIFPSRQIEFSRLHMSYTVLSKRKLRRLVEEGIVEGWDDPRMPTLSGMRRRGYPAAAIRDFCDRIGLTKRDNLIDLSLLEYSVREELNKKANRMMVVERPLKVVVENYEQDEEWLPVENNPEDDTAGVRQVPFSKEIWIEKFDFLEDAPKKYFRLAPGRAVRLKGAYIIECTDYKKDAEGNVVEVYAKYFPESKSGQDRSGIKVKGTIHWVSVQHAKEATIMAYDRLFLDPTPTDHEDKDFLDFLNPDSLEKIEGAKMEPALIDAEFGKPYQFLRKGYYVLDANSTDDQLVFNKTVALRDNWKKKRKNKP